MTRMYLQRIQFALTPKGMHTSQVKHTLRMAKLGESQQSGYSYFIALIIETLLNVVNYVQYLHLCWPARVCCKSSSLPIIILSL